MSGDGSIRSISPLDRKRQKHRISLIYLGDNNLHHYITEFSRGLANQKLKCILL